MEPKSGGPGPTRAATPCSLGPLCSLAFFVRGEAGGSGGRAENRLRAEEAFPGAAFSGQRQLGRLLG